MTGKKLILGVVVGLLVLGVAGVALGHWGGGSGPEMGPPDPAAMRTEFQSGLNGLVKDKVINDKQAETVLQYFDRAFEEMKNMPPFERFGKMRQMKEDGRDPLSLLVKDGVLTQPQADAVFNILPRPHRGMGFGPQMMKARFEQNLNVLVKSDFITAKQAETVLNYFGQAIKELMKKEPGPPCKNGNAPWEKGKDPLSLLVKDGVITAKQADVIALLIPTPPMGFHHRQGHHRFECDR